MIQPDSGPPMTPDNGTPGMNRATILPRRLDGYQFVKCQFYADAHTHALIVSVERLIR